MEMKGGDGFRQKTRKVVRKEESKSRKKMKVEKEEEKGWRQK